MAVLGLVPKGVRRVQMTYIFLSADCTLGENQPQYCYIKRVGIVTIFMPAEPATKMQFRERYSLA